MSSKTKRWIVIICLAAFMSGSGLSLASGIVIDKIYHPYVNPSEQEMEWRAVLQNHQTGVVDNKQVYRFAYGRSLGDHWFAEAYVVTEKSRDQSFRVKGYEMEFRRQLTGQGEYWADWGLLFEIEKEANQEKWEFSTGVLAEKEWGKWSTTANVFLLNTWGAETINSTEIRLGLQARYRYSRSFEPAVEFYSGPDTRGLGPAIIGQIKLPNRRKLLWEAGVIFGLENGSPDQTIRLMLDFEF